MIFSGRTAMMESTCVTCTIKSSVDISRWLSLCSPVSVFLYLSESNSLLFIENRWHSCTLLLYIKQIPCCNGFCYTNVSEFPFTKAHYIVRDFFKLDLHCVINTISGIDLHCVINTISCIDLHWVINTISCIDPHCVINTISCIHLHWIINTISGIDLHCVINTISSIDLHWVINTISCIDLH